MAIELNKVVVPEDCKYIATTPIEELDPNGNFSQNLTITTYISDSRIENLYIIPSYCTYGEFTIQFYRNNVFQSSQTKDEDWNWIIKFDFDGGQKIFQKLRYFKFTIDPRFTYTQNKVDGTNITKNVNFGIGLSLNATYLGNPAAIMQSHGFRKTLTFSTSKTETKSIEPWVFLYDAYKGELIEISE